jgi:3-oxoadipate enol-lactonase
VKATARRRARLAVRSARLPSRGTGGAPVPPAVPPGGVLNLAGRGEVFVRDSGGMSAGPVVLLLHGWTASADINFFPVYASLAESYRVIALDLRGHGRGMRSMEPFSLEDCADDAAAVLVQLGIGQAIVVGYSMGGPVGLLLARRHPERVAALVMQATALEWQRAPRERAVWRLLPLLDLGLRFGAGAIFVERVLRQAAGEDPELHRYLPWLAAEFRRATPRDLVAAGHALSRYDARPWAGQLDVPAAMLVTTRDRLVHPAKQRELAEVLRAAVLEIDADHDAPLANGGEYAKLTRLAVDEVAAAAGLTPGR